MRVFQSAHSCFTHEQVIEKVLDLGLSQAKPKTRPKIQTLCVSETPKESSDPTTIKFPSSIDLIALRQICPPVAKAIEEFFVFLKKIESEISRESDAARLLGTEKAAAYLDISYDNIYRKIKSGALEARWQGRRPYVPLAELNRYIDALPRQPGNKKPRKRNS